MSRRGSALILSFWALMFLTFMGLSVIKRVNAELAIAKYQVGKTRAKYAAFGGLFYVIGQIKKDINNAETRKVDTAFNCGLVLQEGQSSTDILSDVSLGDAKFSVTHMDSDIVGLIDESAKININMLTKNNIGALKHILMVNDVDESAAEMIAASVLDWVDLNDTLFQDDVGAEQEYYQSLNNPYHCKNGPFETLQELMMVRGMSLEIFQKVHSFLTIYPSSGSVNVNLNTASPMVLSALAMAVVGSETGANELDVDGFVEKIIDARNGPDGEWATADDEDVDLDAIPFNSPEWTIAAKLRTRVSSRSTAIRAHIQAVDIATGVKVWLNAVIKTDGLEVVSLNIQ